MANKFMESVLKSLNADKNNYKYIIYDPKRNNIYFAKEQYTLVPQNTQWLRVYDGKLFGVDKRLQNHFELIGEM